MLSLSGKFAGILLAEVPAKNAEGFIAALDALEAQMRAWDGTAKLWWIAAEHEDAIAELFSDFARFRDQMQML